MPTKLIYLHIPKSAGTSHRVYLSEIYGEDNIFWYGLHSDSRKFDPREVGSKPVVGGHRQLDFYPRGLDALYTAVVRNPIERVVSFFNYCTTPLERADAEWSVEHGKMLERWRNQTGMAPDSLSRTLRDCRAFREQVTNYQCRYLSRHGATFDGVMETLQHENIVIGLFDQLPTFNWFFTTQLLFSQANTKQANKGRDGYANPILEEPGLIEAIKEVTAEDQALYDYIASECGGLYVKADNIVSARTQVLALSKSSNFDQPVGEFDWNQVQLYCKGLVAISLQKPLKTPLVIHNKSRQRVLFTETENRVCAIGWQLQDKDAVDIPGANGVSKLQAVVRQGEMQQVFVEMNCDHIDLRGQDPAFVTFYVVDNDDWVRRNYPLSSTWGILAVSGIS